MLYFYFPMFEYFPAMITCRHVQNNQVEITPIPRYMLSPWRTLVFQLVELVDQSLLPSAAARASFAAVCLCNVHLVCLQNTHDWSFQLFIYSHWQ